MSDAPERIGLVGLSKDGPWTLWSRHDFPGMVPDVIEYVRADVADAEVAALRAEVAALREVTPEKVERVRSAAVKQNKGNG